MRLNLRQAMLDAHANTKRTLLCLNLGVAKPSYRALFAAKLKEQMVYQKEIACPSPIYGVPFRSYDEMRREG